MPRAVSQSERLSSELRHQASPAPDVVSLRYRLQTSDLPDAPLHTSVRAVSGQGVEHIVPLLHFAGLTKPLQLDAANIASLIRITGSPVYDDWIGREVQLYRAREGDDLVVRIAADQDKIAHAKSELPAEVQAPKRGLRSRWPALLILLAVAVALVVIYLIENWNQVAPMLSINLGR